MNTIILGMAPTNGDIKQDKEVNNISYQGKMQHRDHLFNIALVDLFDVSGSMLKGGVHRQSSTN